MLLRHRVLLTQCVRALDSQQESDSGGWGAYIAQSIRLSCDPSNELDLRGVIPNEISTVEIEMEDQALPPSLAGPRVDAERPPDPSPTAGKSDNYALVLRVASIVDVS